MMFYMKKWLAISPSVVVIVSNRLRALGSTSAGISRVRFLAPPDDEAPATSVVLRSMGAGAGVEGATMLTSSEHCVESQEACW